MLRRITTAACAGAIAACWIASAEAARRGGEGSSPSSAATGCTPVATAAELNAIRYNLSGSFCLTNDIDFAFAEFVPIGDARKPFVGTFDGGGHTIRNHQMRSALPNVGLFGVLGGADTTRGVRGVVRNLSVEAHIVWAYSVNSKTGVLAGRVAPSGLIVDSRAWSRHFEGRGASGGLAGLNEGEIKGSSSATAVLDYNSYAGGLVGRNVGRVMYSSASGSASGNWAMGGLIGLNEGVIWRSYATGAAGLEPSGQPSGGDSAGGLVGLNQGAGQVRQSFATGPVYASSELNAGLVGRNTGAGVVMQSYATGPVEPVFWSEELGANGGLVGWNENSTIDQSYASGFVTCIDWCQPGGLVGFDQESRATRSFWDRDTTRTSTSSGGVALTTSELQQQLPPGFSPRAWAITPNVTYPFLRYVAFKSPLATTVFNKRVLTFVPIGQRDTWEYQEPATHREQASKAAVFTMIARAIGVSDVYSKALDRTAIDFYFWEDSVQRSYWQGPVKDFAVLGRLTALGPTQSLVDSDLLRALQNDRVAVVRGAYDGPNGPTPHWMLATSYTVDPGGALSRIFANDPWTGRQVQIDPDSKMVAGSAVFPLWNWRMDGYQVVRFREPRE